MAKVIKAADLNRASHGEAFNFEDIEARASRYLDKVRAEAAGIVNQAKLEADDIRKKAEFEGRNTVEEVLRERLAEEVKTLTPALRNVVREIKLAKQSLLKQWEKNLIHVATAIAGRVLRRELKDRSDVTVDLVREALELAVGSEDITINLNPDDYKAISSEIGDVVRDLSNHSETEVVSDETVSAGGCRVVTRFGTIDQQFETQLARIEEELM